jgi:transketolase
MAVGLALAKKIKGEDGRVFCLIGDGECNEGTTWESAMIAAHHHLDNLMLIIDQNSSSERALSLGNLMDKFSAFGWQSTNLFDGHNEVHLAASLKGWGLFRPEVLMCKTLKGNGIPFMQSPEWHNRKMSESEYNEAIKL